MKTATLQQLGLVSADAPTWKHPFAPWMRLTLVLAGFYNMLWGALVILFPYTLFEWCGMEAPNYPELWQCIGMIVGVYGVGYWAAASNPYKHWAIVLVGLLGKFLGPLGFAKALIEARFPLSFGANILTNDLIWWIPFTLILQQAYAHWRKLDEDDTLIYHGQHAITFRHLKSQDGETVVELSQDAPLMLVFLRHIGCTFCRSMLHDLKDNLAYLESEGFTVALVHMSDENAETHAFFEHFGLEELPRFSDKERVLYKSVGLRRGNLNQLFGWESFAKGIPAILDGHGIGSLEGDGFQLSGVVVLHKGIILKVDVHVNASDSTDFIEITKVFIHEH
jgi:peroxiredoxin